MKAYLGGAMLGSSVNASVEVVGVISKYNSSGGNYPSLSKSDFTKGEGWYQVILGYYGNGDPRVIDGLIYYDGTTFNGVLKGYDHYYSDSQIETLMTTTQYVNGAAKEKQRILIYTNTYYTYAN